MYIYKANALFLLFIGNPNPKGSFFKQVIWSKVFLAWKRLRKQRKHFKYPTARCCRNLSKSVFWSLKKLSLFFYSFWQLLVYLLFIYIKIIRDRIFEAQEILIKWKLKDDVISFIINPRPKKWALPFEPYPQDIDWKMAAIIHIF